MNDSELKDCFDMYGIFADDEDDDSEKDTSTTTMYTFDTASELMPMIAKNQKHKIKKPNDTSKSINI